MKVKNSIHFYFLPFLTFCFRHKTSASCFLKSMFHLTQTLFLSSPNNLMLQSASGQSHDVKSKQSWVLNKSWSPIKNVCTWLEFHNPRKVGYLGEGNECLLRLFVLICCTFCLSKTITLCQIVSNWLHCFNIIEAFGISSKVSSLQFYLLWNAQIFSKKVNFYERKMEVFAFISLLLRKCI